MLMKPNLTRRSFITTAGAAALASTVVDGAAEAPGGTALKIIGISCSPRQGQTTASAVQTALDAAKAVDPRIQTELIDLGGLNIAPWSPKPPADDMAGIFAQTERPGLGRPHHRLSLLFPQPERPGQVFPGAPGAIARA